MERYPDDPPVGHVGKETKAVNSTGVPPLPIPNREVKPRRADGTAKVGE